MATKEDLERLKQLLTDTFAELKVAKDTMDEMSEWDTPAELMANIQKVQAIIEMLAVVGNELQTFFNDVDDNELAEILAQFLDDAVKLPIYLEPFDGLAFKIVIGYAIRAVREYMDKLKERPEVVDASGVASRLATAAVLKSTH